jgi:hypothetical protein
VQGLFHVDTVSPAAQAKPKNLKTSKLETIQYSGDRWSLEDIDRGYLSEIGISRTLTLCRNITLTSPWLLPSFSEFLLFS